jgi:hypothetical protein
MIDLYCERLGPGLWAEPINALTNLAFFLAAWAAWRFASQKNAPNTISWVLIGLMVAIGLGSGLFHTYATNWARWLDIIPILLFQIAYLLIYGRIIINVRPAYLAGAVAIYLALAMLGRQFPHVLNGALIYAPAFVLLLVLGIYHYLHASNQRYMLFWALGVFSISLFFRTIDMAVCDTMPIGTHFFWHLFNGLLVYLAFKALLLNLPVIQGRGT